MSKPDKRTTLGDTLGAQPVAAPAGPRPGWGEQDERLVDTRFVKVESVEGVQLSTPTPAEMNAGADITKSVTAVRGFQQQPVTPVPTEPRLRRGTHVDVRWLARVAVWTVIVLAAIAVGFGAGRYTAQTEVRPSECVTTGNGNVVCTYPQDLGIDQSANTTEDTP